MIDGEPTPRSIPKANVSDRLLPVLEEIVRAGGVPRYCGGCVRDKIVNVVSKDVDIEVYKIPMEDLQKVLERFGQVDLVGKSFGVLKLHSLGDVDFSIPRRDNKTGIGHKDFVVSMDHNMSPKEAASRRDLTMNALAEDCFTGEVFDFFGGLDDMKNNRMRATDAATFLEDPLRALRVMQFISRFPNMVPDKELIQLCSQADLSHLSEDRLWEEFKKMLLKGSRPDLGLEFLKQTGLLRFFPELQALVGCQQHPAFHAEGSTVRRIL